jgi:uncharacterized protein YoxC
MTHTLTEVLLLLLAAAGVVAVVYVVKLVNQLSRTAAEAERFIAQLNQLSPQLNRILTQTEGELADLRQVTQKVDAIAGNVGAISQKVAGFVAPSTDGAGTLAGPIRYITAAMTGVKVVMQLLKQRKAEQAESAEPELQVEKD